MIRTYATPAAFKAALEQRLRNQVLAGGGSLDRLRQLVVFERFLARLFTVFEEAVILKGGLVLELRLQRARTTKDVDLRLVGRPDRALASLQQAAQLDLGDHLQFRVMADPRHPVIQAEGMQYEGLRFRTEAHLSGKLYGRPFGVDAAFAEPLVGEPEIVTGSSLLEFAGLAPVSYRVYPLETHVAEKLHAYTLPRQRPNSRVKDLPDLPLLASVRAVDAAVLRRSIQGTFQHRNTHPVPSLLPEPPPAWEPVYAEMAAVDELAWRSLAEVTKAARAFLEPVLRGENGRWDPLTWTWNPP